MLEKYVPSHGGGTRSFYAELQSDCNKALECSGHEITVRSFYARYKETSQQKKWRVKQLTSRGDFHGTMCETSSLGVLAAVRVHVSLDTCKDAATFTAACARLVV